MSIYSWLGDFGVWHLNLHLQRLPLAGTLLHQLDESDDVAGFSPAGRERTIAGQSSSEFAIVLRPCWGFRGGVDFPEGLVIFERG